MFNIFVINLHDRLDRIESIYKNFSNYFNIIVIEGIKDNNGSIGCFLSHKKCIEIAKNNKLDKIIVIEDDCIPKDNNFFDRFKIINEYLDNNDDWNIFLGAVTDSWKENIIKHNIYKNETIVYINKGKTAHFIIYNKNCYDFFLNHDMKIPIDKCWYYNLNAITIVPFLAIQLSGLSNIENKIIDYNSRFNCVEKYLINHLKNKN